MAHYWPSPPPHKVFGHMAEKYGPSFRLKLGVNEVVIVSDPKIAKESKVSEILGYNYAMFGLGPYGPYWREIRKIVTIEFFSARRIQMFTHTREFEVKSVIKEIYNYWVKNQSCTNLNGAVKMEMKDWFDNLIMNTMVKMLFGVQYTADLLPYLRWLDIGGHEKAMKETAKEMESIVEDWLAEHRRKRELRGNKCGDEKDFMDVMLSICEDKDLPAEEECPFGSGRRMCPGVSLGLQVVQYVLAVLLRGLDMKGPSSEPIDMSENFGLINRKASPLEVHLAPRLNSNLYK
ncbi:hypothetical protein HAX54_023731 [Datura stramonium]|uniref:Cytochrome P450 n=1 Tax=Datura stramonium TaxID=4076 RepID=A0ABS8UZ05_DATST|nr:hypothetical protein [Datura stramonium]